MEEPYDHTRIDDIIHGRLRLGIMAYLSTAHAATFLELKARTKSTDGNLSTHVAKLEEAGYVKVEKSFEGKKPVTRVLLTETGRSAWIVYLDQMRAMLRAAE